jgi:hypothetical protein
MILAEAQNVNTIYWSTIKKAACFKLLFLYFKPIGYIFISNYPATSIPRSHPTGFSHPKFLYLVST